MTIVHVMQPFASGVVTAAAGIAGQLPQANHVVIHGTRLQVDDQDKVKARFPAGVTFIPWPSVGRELSLKGDYKALRELIRLLKPYRGQDTVIHLHSSKAGFLGRLACRLLGIKRVVYTPHCGAFLRTDISPWKRRLFRGLERLGSRFGGVVVGCGKSEGEAYAALDAGDGAKARWVSNGIPITPYRKAESPDLVTFAGVASTQKNPALFNAIAAAFPETPFHWIGDGPLAGLLSAPNITVTGWLGRPQIEALLERTLVFLSTSSWEGLPFAVLEAMNAGCALLLTDAPGNRDLVTPGENGFLFHDAPEGIARLKEMLAAPERSLQMGLKSRDLAERCYSLEAMGRGYGTIYTAMLN